MIERPRLHRAALAAATAGAVAVTGLVAAPGAQAAVGTFSQLSPIVINDDVAATPYPSNIAVSGMPKGITDVNVSLNSFDHTYPDDVDVVLVGPAGQFAVLMSDAGDGVDVSGVNLTIDDQATSSL